MSAIIQKAEKRIRGPELVLMHCNPGKSFVDAWKMAEKSKLVLPSSKRMTRAMVKSEEWRNVGFHDTWTGTMAAYGEPDKPLGETITYLDCITRQRWIFVVPKEYQKEKNVLLVSEHPDYSLGMCEKDIVVLMFKADLIANFPTEKGWYLTDKVHDMPRGEKLDVSVRKALFLHRLKTKIGPVSRHTWMKRNVNLGALPSYPRDMVVEAPEEKIRYPKVVKKTGELIIRGTQENLETALRLLRPLLGN